jgi:hypothetical protein
MSDLFFGKRRTIFDILEESEEIKAINEAPEDDAGGDDGGADTGADDAAADDAGGDDNAGDQDNADDNADNTDEDMGNDEDFDVDTSIDDDSTDNDSASTDDSSMDSGGGSDFGGDSEEEVIPQNTNIFSSLTKEEQAIKISELKKIFNNLYIYTSDMLEKINDINPDEDNLESIYRITSALYELKQNIGDYIKNIFPIKSYIENDIAYNRYLIIIRSITNTMNIIATEMEQKVQKETKK